MGSEEAGRLAPEEGTYVDALTFCSSHPHLTLPHNLGVQFFWKVCLVGEDGENLTLHSDANRRLGCGGGVKGMQ